MNPSEAPRHKVVGTVVCLPARDLDTSVAFYKQVFDLPDSLPRAGSSSSSFPISRCS